MKRRHSITRLLENCIDTLTWTPKSIINKNRPLVISNPSDTECHMVIHGWCSITAITPESSSKWKMMVSHTENETEHKSFLTYNLHLYIYIICFVCGKKDIIFAFSVVRQITCHWNLLTSCLYKTPCHSLNNNLVKKWKHMPTKCVGYMIPFQSALNKSWKK